MANVWQPIDNGQIQSAARFYTITVAAGGVYTLNSPFNVCKCISSNQSSFKVAWSSQSSETDFAQGWKVRFDTVIPYVQIFNPSQSVLTVTLGLGVGDIDDSSFVLSNSSIQVEEKQYSGFASSELILSEAGAAYISPTSSIAKIIIQNTTTGDLRIFSRQGLIIKPLGTFESEAKSGFNVYGNPNEKIVYARFTR